MLIFLINQYPNVIKIIFNLLLSIFFSCGNQEDILSDSNDLEPTMVINEINYNSSNEFDPGDWVELYNATGDLLNIGDWTFKDGNDSHIFTILENTLLSAGEYIVLCSDTNSFTALFPDVINFAGDLGFRFSGNGEMLRLYNSDNILIDRVNYDDSDPWPVSPDGNGPTLELIDPLSDNSKAENWTASEENGSPAQSNN